MTFISDENWSVCDTIMIVGTSFNKLNPLTILNLMCIHQEDFAHVASHGCPGMKVIYLCSLQRNDRFAILHLCQGLRNWLTDTSNTYRGHQDEEEEYQNIIQRPAVS